MTQLLTYNGYKIAVRDANPEAAVFDPRNPRAPALYKTTSLDLACKWIDAYVQSEQDHDQNINRLLWLACGDINDLH